MKLLPVLILLTLMLTGCASLRKPGGILYSQGQERKLAAAVRLLEEGKITAAKDLLAALCAEPAVPGVTDEALFRLGLLSLEAEPEKDGQQTLGRLQREYPASPWTRQAGPLMEFLATTGDQQRLNRNLKSLNLSLTRENRELARENKELRQNIDKLKHLDLELERQNKPP